MTETERSRGSGSTNKYDVIARAFTVLDVATPIKHYVKPKESLQHVWERIDDEWFIVVRDDRKIYGYLAVDDDAFNSPITGNAQSRASQISPDIIVPGAMPLLDLVPLFESRYFYFVLTTNNITHVVSFNDLDSMPMKLCLFSLFMDLEAAILQVLLSGKRKAEEHLQLLSENRIKKAQDLCRMKYKQIGSEKSIDPVKTIYCTTFIDKVTMLSKSNVYEFLQFPSKNKIHDFFVLVEKTRNQIAHGDSILGMFDRPGKMHQMVSDLKGMLEAFQRG